MTNDVTFLTATSYIFISVLDYQKFKFEANDYLLYYIGMKVAILYKIKYFLLFCV